MIDDTTICGSCLRALDLRKDGMHTHRTAGGGTLRHKHAVDPALYFSKGHPRPAVEHTHWIIAPNDYGTESYIPVASIELTNAIADELQEEFDEPGG